MENKKEIVEKLGELINGSEEFANIIPQVKQFRAEFVELVKQDHETLKKAHEESESEEEFKPPHDELDSKFSDLMAAYNQKRKVWEEQRAHELNQNLEIKRKIIGDLDKLIEEEHHIGHAFEKFNELKEKWKNTGNVPSSDYKELQRDYSHQIERFFYNINIYKTLKEYDLQKNLQLKHEVIEKVKTLQKNDNIKEIRDLITAYIHEWDEIGPTHQSQWEKVRDDFWENVREVHKKIGDHYKHQKEKIKENLEAKEKLCEQVEELVKRDLHDLKQWNKSQKELNNIRADWKKIGFAGKKTNDEIWKRFRKAVDSFYAHKKETQEELKPVFKEHEDRKLKLIERAEEMKESMDWKNTANDFKKLQSDWKRVGTTHPAREQKLWKKFRAASDHFFDRRKDYFDNREEREQANLDKKKEVLEKLKALDESKGKELLEHIKSIGKDWNTIGYVPKEEKQKIESEYHKVVNEKMKAIGLEKKEIEKRTFEFKIEGYKEADNAEELLLKEYRNLDVKLKEIQSSIKQYENNLGFFSGGSDNPLVKEVEQKIETSKKEAGQIKARMDMLTK